MITSILNTIQTSRSFTGQLQSDNAQTKPRPQKWHYRVPLISIVALASACGINAAVHADAAITCGYDPASGQPNPLGNRAFITATEAAGNTQFVYEVFPSPVAGGGAITIESKRTLVFYKTAMEDARGLLRENLNFYYELIGYEDTAGFSSYDEAMSCKQG